MFIITLLLDAASPDAMGIIDLAIYMDTNTCTMHLWAIVFAQVCFTLVSLYSHDMAH